MPHQKDNECSVSYFLEGHLNSIYVGSNRMFFAACSETCIKADTEKIYITIS